MINLSDEKSNLFIEYYFDISFICGVNLLYYKTVYKFE